MVNIKLLRDKIDESGMTVTAVCEKSGILRQTMYKRYENPNFTVEEIGALKRVLRLTQRDVHRIFFAANVN